MNVDMDSIVINIESTTQKATNAIDTLISKLNSLQQALSGVGKSSNNFQKIGKSISNTPKISTPKRNGSDLQSQLDGLKINLKDYDVYSAFKSQNTKGITTEITRYKNELGNVVTVEKKMKDGMEDYYRVTQRTTKDNTTAWEKFKNSIAGSVAKVAALYGVARGLSNSLVELTETSAEYTEAVNLFYTEMGDKAQEAEKWVKKFSDALYLDPSDVMAYMGSFNSLIHGLGVGVDNSYKMSKNLTQLAYDLASYKNISYEQAYDKLSSGIAGQIKGLRQVGVALSQNTLQELANELGIQQRVTTMDEASKAQLRYIQIMRSSTNWQADLGKTMMSTENILRSARQQWTLMVRALGDVAAVIVRQVMPYFIALTQLIKEAAISLARFFGLDIDFADAFKTSGGSIATDLGGIEDGIEDVGGAARKAKKDINTMLAPFDDLNVVQTELEKTGSGVGGATGGVGLGDLPLPEYDALAKLTKEWSNQIDQAKDKMKKMIPIAATLAGIVATIWGINKIGKFIGSLQTIGGVFKGLGVIGGGSFGTIAAAFALALGKMLLIKKELPNIFKLFDDVIIKGKDIKKVTKEYSTLQKVLMGVAAVFTIMDPNSWFLVLGEGIKYVKKNSIETTDVVKDLSNNISKTGSKKLTPLVSEFEKLLKTTSELDLGKKIIDAKDLENVQSSLSKIRNSIINELDADENAQLKRLKPLEKTLGIEKAQEIYAKTESYYSGQKDIITRNSDEITKILQQASDNNTFVTQEEWNTINKLRNEMYETGVASALEYSDDYYYVMSQLKNNVVALSIEQASSFIQNAQKTRDKTIKAAEEQYNKTIAEAYKMKEVGAITKEQYDDIVAAAEQTKQDAINAANKQYDEIYNTTTEKLGNSSKYIDDETGKIKTKWQVFTDALKTTWDNSLTTIKTTLSNKWGEITKWYNEKIAPKFTKEYWKNKFDNLVRGASEKLQELKNLFTNWTASIKTPHFNWVDGGIRAKGVIKTVLETLNLPTTIPKLNVQWYEQGGYPTRGDLFWANENGIPEMVGRIGNQTAVANNDQITTALTNALISALSGMNFGGQGTTVVNIGNKKVYEGMGEYINNESERYGTTYITV